MWKNALTLRVNACPTIITGCNYSPPETLGPTLDEEAPDDSSQSDPEEEEIDFNIEDRKTFVQDGHNCFWFEDQRPVKKRRLEDVKEEEEEEAMECEQFCDKVDIKEEPPFW